MEWNGMGDLRLESSSSWISSPLLPRFLSLEVREEACRSRAGHTSSRHSPAVMKGCTLSSLASLSSCCFGQLCTTRWEQQHRTVASRCRCRNPATLPHAPLLLLYLLCLPRLPGPYCVPEASYSPAQPPAPEPKPSQQPASVHRSIASHWPMHKQE